MRREYWVLPISIFPRSIPVCGRSLADVVKMPGGQYRGVCPAS